MRILIAEDDLVLADGLLRTLRASGAAADHVASGTEADAALMTTDEFDLLILGLGLPKMHGLEVLKRLRSRGSSIPVLILTAADGVEERVKGLDYGADDYMAKPFSLQELEARARALHRRHAHAAPQEQQSALTLGALRLERDSGALYCRGAVMDLSPRELALMAALLARPGHAMAKERLFELVFPGVADVQFAVGIRWAVVQHKQRCALACHAQFFVQALLVPLLGPSGFAFGQVATHGERGVHHV